MLNVIAGSNLCHYPRFPCMREEMLIVDTLKYIERNLYILK